MANNKKRKQPLVENDPTSSKRKPEAASADESTAEQAAPAQDAKPQSMQDRMARFQALKARNTESRASNRKETAAEAQRLSTDPNALTAIQRKHAIASQKLLKAETEAAGEDFERKRAWDWTVDESEKWDERLAEKKRNRDDVAFQDWRQNARKVYEREIKQLNAPDLEKYRLEKAEALRKAAEDGTLQVIEDENGELLPVDHSGAFFPTADAAITGHKPDKDAIDRLVGNLNKAEEIRAKKRKQRGHDDDGDVTYINDKNKQFNLRLARAYNKYTTEIRDNFERGTAIWYVTLPSFAKGNHY